MINWIVSSSVLILLITITRAIFKGRIKLKIQYALWLFVLVRLIAPIQLGNSQLSVSNYILPLEKQLEAVQNVQLFEDIGQTDLIESVEQIKKEDIVQSPSKQHNNFDLVDALLVLWLCGAAVTALSIIMSNLSFCIRLRRSRKSLGVYCGLPVYECLWLDTPCLFGLFRPSIYIKKHEDKRELKYIVCHEAMHFKQGDHIWALFRSMCLVLHWYNPLVWMAAVLSKQDGELSCDEAVIKALGESERFGYGRTLVFMSCKGRTPLLNMSTSMKGAKTSIGERIGLIASKPKMRAGSLLTIIFLTAVIVGCTFTGKEIVPTNEVGQENVGDVEIEVAVPVVKREGKFMDRNGLAFDPEKYEGLAGVKESLSYYYDDGCRINLTIDSRLQEKTESLLADALAESADSSAAAVVVVNVNSGEPLAIVSHGSDKNLALQGMYEPRNLFLPCTAIAAIGSGIIDAGTEIECTGVFDRYQQEGYTISCTEKHTGEQTVLSALENNCLYYFYALGNDCGIDIIEEYARALGLGEWSGIDLDSVPGTMANRAMYSPWRIGDTIEAAVGQKGSQFTPIQYAEYCAAIANGGSRYHAGLIYRMVGGSSSTYTREVTANTYANIGVEGYNAIRQAMYNIGNKNNSALREWATGQWPVSGIGSGKTGISDKLYMGFAPFDKPEIAIAVVVEETADEYAAEKLAKEVVQAYQQIRGQSPW